MIFSTASTLRSTAGASFALFLWACSSEPPASTSSSVDQPDPAAVGFQGQVLTIGSFDVGLGPDAGIEVRATVEVVESWSKSVEVPARAACRFGEHTVVGAGLMLPKASSQLSAARKRKYDVTLRSETPFRALGPLETCDIEVRLVQSGVDVNVPPPVETLCFRAGRATRGACGGPGPKPPVTPRAHSLEVSFAPSVQVRGALQVVEAGPPDASMRVHVACTGSAIALEDIVLLPKIALAAGESVSFASTPVRAGSQPAESPCTVTLWGVGRAEAPPTPLGVFCATRKPDGKVGVDSGACR